MIPATINKVTSY